MGENMSSIDYLPVYWPKLKGLAVHERYWNIGILMRDQQLKWGFIVKKWKFNMGLSENIGIYEINNMK